MNKVYKIKVWENPERKGGIPCFYGTRIPVFKLASGLEMLVERFGNEKLNDAIEELND